MSIPIEPGKRILVCGGRKYPYFQRISEVLREWQPSLVITGTFPNPNKRFAEQVGADCLAVLWCQCAEIPCLVVPAPWAKRGNFAGPVRNQKMLDDGKPDVVIAFPGGDGTADMVRRARNANIPVVEVPA